MSAGERGALRAADGAPCDCETALAELEDYLRRECCDDRARAIRAHLEDCPGCRRELEASERLVEVVRRSCREAAPETVRLRIVEAIRRTPCGGGRSHGSSPA